MAEYIVNTDVEESRYRAIGANYAPYFEHKIATLLGNPVMEEVIRCRDCKYYEYLPNYDFHYCERQIPIVAPSGFCAWGDRRVE